MHSLAPKQKRPSPVSRSVPPVAERIADSVPSPVTTSSGYDERKAARAHPIFTRGLLWPGLTISAPNDPMEQEADLVAERVMETPGPQATFPTKVQPKTEPAQGNVAPPIVHDVLNSCSQPLDFSSRAFFEPRFGQDFGQVRVHTGNNAAAAAMAIDGIAFTVGNHIVFGQDRYRPNSDLGKRLLAHELTHVAQQTRSAEIKNSMGGAVSRVQRQTPQGIKPKGSASQYVPTRKGLDKELAGDNAAGRKQKIESFLVDVFGVWSALKAQGYWEKLKNVESLAMDSTVTGNIKPVPDKKLFDSKAKKKVKTSYADPAVRFSIGADPKPGEALLDEREKLESGNIAATDYADISNTKIVINQYAQDSGQATAALMSLRDIQTAANRLQAALLASKDANIGYSLPEVLALYQQEGNKEMPASAESLKDDIPTGVDASVSSVGYGADKIEISSGVLVLNPDFFLPDKKVSVKAMSEERLKFFALRLYVNHIGGLDVIHQFDTIAQLAQWSLKNLMETGAVKNTAQDPSMESQALDAEKIKWAQMRDGLQIMKAPGAYTIAPSDPVNFVKDILTETMIYLKRYSDIKRALPHAGAQAAANQPSPAGQGAGAATEIPLSLTYMQFNSSALEDKSGKPRTDRPRELITSALKAAKSYKGTARFDQLRTELSSLPLAKLGNYGDVENWLMGLPPYEAPTSSLRWKLVMDFIENAGYEDWKNNWAGIRGHASLLRTQAEFYKVAFE